MTRLGHTAYLIWILLSVVASPWRSLVATPLARLGHTAYLILILLSVVASPWRSLLATPLARLGQHTNSLFRLLYRYRDSSVFIINYISEGPAMIER